MTGAGAAPALLWFRQDLRLSDNPALAAALERRSPVIPVFIWAPGGQSPSSSGAGRRLALVVAPIARQPQRRTGEARIAADRSPWANGGNVEPPGGGIGRIGRSVESPL